MSEISNVDNKMSRRSFLKILGSFLGSIALGGHLTRSNRGITAPEVMHAQFPDTLTEVDLQAHHITINQSLKVKLYLQKNILELPIFKDIENNEIDGVVVTLVDHPQLNWAAGNQMPDEAKEVWHAAFPHPSESHDEMFWNQALVAEKSNERLLQEQIGEIDMKESDTEGGFNFLRNVIEQGKKDLEEDPNDEFAELYEHAIVRNEAELKDELEKYELQKPILEQKRKELNEKLRIAKEQTEQKKQEIVIREEDENTQIGGVFSRPILYTPNGEKDPTLVKKMQALMMKRPEIKNKVYIFFAVGGTGQTPHPKESHPSPNQFEPSIDGIYLFNKPTIGASLAHEFEHYEKNRYASEIQADAETYQLFVRAWDEYIRTGKTSKYPFIFATEEGNTITRRHFLDPRTLLKQIANI